MSIEFIRDEFLEGKKEELDSINKEMSIKAKKTDKNALFLRRFTLAMMGQHRIKNKNLIRKNEEIEIINKRLMDETRKLHEFKRPIQRIMPQPPMSIPMPAGLSVPTPRPQDLKVPVPLNEGLKVPSPIKMEKSDEPQANIKPRKEVSAPKPL